MPKGTADYSEATAELIDNEIKKIIAKIIREYLTNKNRVLYL